MTLLAIDTSASLCAAAVFDGEAELGRFVLDLGKGHAEHLMAVIEEALHAAGKSYADLGRIAVAIGPGSFTGIRVGVATARGLALALKIPAFGISNLEAVAAEARGSHPGKPIFVAFASARGAIQAAIYDQFANLAYPPSVIDLAQALQLATEHDAVIVGSAAPLLIAENTRLISSGEAVTADISVYARLATQKAPSGERPKPLYLREPDAKPQASFVLPRVGQ